MDLANIAQRAQDVKGQLHACRSALATDRTRVATREDEEKRLLAELETLEADAAVAFEATRAVGLPRADEPAEPGHYSEALRDPSPFGEPAQVAAE